MRTVVFLACSFLLACGGSTIADLGDGGDAGKDASVAIDTGLVTNPDAGLPPDCGGAGQMCCKGETCKAGGCCVDTACVASGDTCGGGANLGTCKAGACGSCGGVGEPCCAMKESDNCSGVTSNCGGCTAPQTTCPSGQIGDTCITCGGDGQPCCANACVGAFSRCAAQNGSDSICKSDCGGPGQPCCDYGLCKGGCCMGDNTCPVDTSFCGCTDGKCTTCGTDGQPCCAGNLCEYSGGQCYGGTCQTLHP